MKTPLRFLAFAIVSAAIAHSQVVLFTNMVTPSDNTHGGPYVRGSASPGGVGRQDVAEQFQTTLATPAFLTSVVAPFHAFGAAGPMSGTVTLFADFGNNPGSILETAGFSATLLNSVTSLITVNFSGSTSLAAGTNYWIGFSVAPGSTFWEQWDNAQPGASNRVETSTNGTSWTVSVGAAAPGLTVNGRVGAVPEPASYGIVAVCALTGIVAWRRRRPAFVA